MPIVRAGSLALVLTPQTFLKRPLLFLFLLTFRPR